jgi:3-phenylpropionate/trans-cinnamate dioxygenase ferredoxin reductase component
MGGDFVIVGAGECGGRAALALRAGGHDGPITMIGDEPHAPYEAILSQGDPAPRPVGMPAAFEEAGIVHLKATAWALDRAGRVVTLADGKALSYDRLLLATGARARRLKLPGADDPRCLTLRSFEDALAIRAHIGTGRPVAILGGGFIGLELAASARRRGVPVTLIEAQPRLLMRGVPEPIAATLEARHRAEGVDVRTGTGVAAIEPAPDALRLTLTDGSRLSAGLLVLGIGAAPNVELAHAAGLAVDNGIAVDERLMTSDPAIFAAGDCCSWPSPLYNGRRLRLEAWRSAQETGALAARNMLGANETISAVPWFWSDQYDMTLQIAGLADGAVHTIQRDCGEDALILFHLDADGRLLAASGIGPGNAIARDIRLAEMLIARRARPDVAALASVDVKLKTLLAA